MAQIKSNERELAQKVTQWLDEHIKRGNFLFKEATSELGIKVDGRTYFADVIIWKDRSSNQAFSYLELKPPNGKEDIERFRKKAVALEVKYAFTWDFQTRKTYRVVDNDIEPIDSEIIPVLSNINEWKRGDKQALIKTVIRKICDDLVHLQETGKPHKFIPDKVFFVNLIRNATEQLLTIFELFIHQAQHKKDFKETIKQYARVQGIPQTVDYTKVLTNHVVYGLVTKIIFYLTVRRYFTDLPSLEEIEETDLNVVIRKAFSKARDKDWQAVFEEDPIEQLGIPKDAYQILYNFFSELKAYHFGELPEDVIGQLFEEIIDPEKRHNLGQYFTREDLVDLVIATVVHDANGIYCDPTCGSGTFLVRLYDRLRYLSSNRGTHRERLNQIWGFDVGKFPAELSTINLFRQDISDYDNFPRVRKTDIFDVKVGDTFDFPPPHYGASSVKVQLKLPQFNGLVGNFPYIRQELIEKEIKGYKNKLTNSLAQEYYHLYPKLFTLQGITSSQLGSSKQIETAVDKDWLDLCLSGQADIYAYIYLHTATFLKVDGAFAIITSNKWLDVSFGTILKQFFLDHFRVKMIIASWAEPWFDDVAENTVVTVLEKEIDERKRNQNYVHFVKLRKKLSEIIPQSLFDYNRRWQRFDGLINTIEEARYKAKPIVENIATLETEEMRIRVVPQRAIAAGLQNNAELAKWGKYLRAPDVYFEILEKCKDKLVPLKDIADVRFGIKTGINEFFYLTPAFTLSKAKSLNKKKKKDSSPPAADQNDKMVKCCNDLGWEGGIEEVYLQRVIKDSSQFEKIYIEPSDVKDLLFVCDKPKNELRKLGHVGALKYIEWGEKQVNESKIPFPQIQSVKNRKLWYNLPKEINDEVIYLAAPRNRFLAFSNKHRFLLDKRLYSVKPKKQSVLSILNSFINILHLEAYGRDVNNGNAKEFTIDDVENMLVPKDEIDYDMASISKRKIKPIFEEVKQKDRHALDTAVLEALGLNPKEYLPRIYDGLCEMVKERLELPKMRKKQQKDKVKFAFDKTKEEVAEECLPNGPKRFPEAFYESEQLDKDLERYPTSGQPLSYQHFFGQYEVKDESGQKIFTTDSELKVQFAQLLAKPDVYELKIPKNEKVVKKALAAYRKYVKDLQEQLTASAHMRTHDWVVAERLSKELMEEFGIKAI